MKPVTPVNWNVQDEWSSLEAVMVGTGSAMGPAPQLEGTFDPQSRAHVLAGTYPTEQNVCKELEAVAHELETRNIRVLRPDLVGLNQVFTRDIGLVIGNRFIMTHMVEDRVKEQEGLTSMLHRNSGKVLVPPAEVQMEGGDILAMGKEIWVGYAKDADFKKYTTARTNAAALPWLQEQFPNLHVRGFELKKSDTLPHENALHLDCCLAPLGLGHAIYHPDGFKNLADVEWIRSQYDESHRIELSADEMQRMHGNVFSVAPNTVISAKGFDRTNTQMKRWGYEVIEIDFHETSKMGGLLRCSTLPLRRTPNL